MAAAAPSDAADTETIELLADSARDFCARALGVERLRALRGATPPFDRAAWQEMCELGWSSIVAREASGGLELGAAAVGAVCRQLGRVVAPEPMLECGVAAAAVLSRTATGDELAEALTSGTALVGAALAEPDELPGGADSAVRATRGGSGIVLNGRVNHVALGTVLDTLLVPASADDGALLVALPCAADGVSQTAVTQADGTAAAHFELRDVALDSDACLATGSDAEAAVAYGRDMARMGAAAYLVGLGERVYEITLDYLRTRAQFGRAIGSFQALQHRAVDLYIQTELADACLGEAERRFDAAGDAAERAEAASRAKYRATEAALRCAREAVQMHGGIGYTDECDVGLYLNRALVISAWLGNAAFHAERLSARLSASRDEDTPAPASLPAEPANGEWDSIDDESFRHIVRRFFETEYPSELRYPPSRLRWAQIRDWYLKLSEKGWIAPAWPAAHGGMGLSPSKLLVFIEEQERWGVGRAPDMGISMVGPLLIQHGTVEQQQRYLPRILAGDEIWCQGYSEPNAGSDLASLRTEAVADGDEFVINGQKTWTTLAQDATHMFCLARTSKEGKQQEGISFFLIDFKQAGVTVRPIRNIAGHEEFCEVFLDDVRVPADCLVGNINEGWTIAKALLGFERIFLGSPKQSQYALMRLEELLAGAGLGNDPLSNARLTRLRLDVLDLVDTYQQFADIVRRGEALGPEVSLLKIWATETFARISEMLVETAGAAGATVGNIAFGDEQVDVMTQFYNARPATIYGGSNEIQRNILSKAVLRLPS